MFTKLKRKNSRTTLGSESVMRQIEKGNVIKNKRLQLGAAACGWSWSYSLPGSDV